MIASLVENRENQVFNWGWLQQDQKFFHPYFPFSWKSSFVTSKWETQISWLILQFACHRSWVSRIVKNYKINEQHFFSSWVGMWKKGGHTEVSERRDEKWLLTFCPVLNFFALSFSPLAVTNWHLFLNVILYCANWRVDWHWHVVVNL